MLSAFFVVWYSSCMLKALLTALIFFGVAPVAFAEFTYDRNPSSFTNYTETGSLDFYFDVETDSMADLGLSDLAGLWGIWIKNIDETFQQATPCEDLVATTTLSNEFYFDLPIDEYILVAAIQYYDIETCLGDPSDLIGGIELEYDFDLPVFEVVQSDIPVPSVGVVYGYTPLFETATSTCVTEETITTCTHTYPLQISYLDWMQVNLWIIFLLAINVLGIFFSLTLKSKQNSS